MKNNDYNATISWSTKELNLSEILFIKGGPDAVTVDKALEDADSLIVDVDFICVTNLHNERANGDKDYKVIYIIDKNGMTYRSSSESLLNSIEDIEDILSDNEALISDYPIKIYGMPSKKYTGKFFYKASVLLKKEEN